MIGTGFQITRTNMTELDRPDSPCSNDPELYNDVQPGLVLSPDGPKTLDQCIVDFYHKELGCRLPWGKHAFNKTEKSFSNIAASQFCFSRSNKSTTTLQF
jgi:hypothetical protein